MNCLRVQQKSFTVPTTGFSYVRLPVQDKTGANVETKYKVTEGKDHVCTLNLYHTKCTCLINGRKTSQFLETDLPSVISIIDSRLAADNMTVHSVNEAVKTV